MQDANSEPQKKAPLAEALDYFSAGRITDCWAILAQLNREKSGNPELFDRLVLSCAIYQVGDLDAAMELNRSLPMDRHLPIRYRLAFRRRDAALCRKIRNSPVASEKEKVDFSCTAGISLLWWRKYSSGFRHYQSRAGAINFTKILPDDLKYAPLPEDPADDLPVVMIEQGVGDVIMHLPALREFWGDRPVTFLASGQFVQLFRSVFPQAIVVRFDQRPKELQNIAVHCSADYLGRYWNRHGKLGGSKPLSSPLKRRKEPLIGICWRGGSGQNRREERHIPLQYFLDLLPKGFRYVALQFDLTDQERNLLHSLPDVQVPAVSLTKDTQVTLEMIRSLAGVISVDSANLHMAGMADVPVLALMNRTCHWYWGPEEKVETVYRSAETMAKEAMSPDRVLPFLKRAEAEYAKRRSLVAQAKVAAFERPVFVTGLPRSGTSLTTGLLQQSGLWLGETIGPTEENKRGFFENRQIREGIIKPLLSAAGCDPLGVKSLPEIDNLPLVPELARILAAAVSKQGHSGQVWGYKDPKLTLLWPAFAEAFPAAHWIIVRRKREDVIRSITATSFMRRHSQSREYWEMFAQSYEWRLQKLAQSENKVTLIDADPVLAGDFSQLADLAPKLGLTFRESRARELLLPSQ